MHMFLRSILKVLLLLAAVPAAQAQRLTGYVDPYIGSGGHGHVFVGANVPFGAVQAGPMNYYKGWDWLSGYNYTDSTLIGFTHLHLSGTGIGDLGDVLVMPFTGPVRTGKSKQETYRQGYGSKYVHEHEKVKPGYYAVRLEDHDIEAALTATERVGYHRYRFPEGKDAHVIIDLKEGMQDKSYDTYIEQTDAVTLKGYRYSRGWAKDQRVYFAIRLSKPMDKFAVYEEDSLLNGNKAQGVSIKGLISFNAPPGTLELKVGLSPVSADNALANIEAEIPGWNFDEIARQADEKWEKELSAISIKTSNEAHKRIFYTALYHTMINPSLFNDHDKSYRGADKKVVTKANFDHYSVFSLWDTYRAVHPLYALTQPQRVNDMVNSMLAIYDQQGKLPIWHLMGWETGTMVGISSVQVIAEAYLKGFRGFDAERAWKAIRSTLMSDTLGLGYVRDFKPIPSDVKVFRPVARALEYAIGDGSVALMAKAMGKQEDAAYFSKRAKNYQLYYDPKTMFIRGKMSDGSWNPFFDPVKSYRPWAADYAEGNSWQYLWLAPQDVHGLKAMLGGDKMFLNKLDTFFTLEPEPDPKALIDLTGGIGQYAHGNEPSHHIAYLYAYGGQQWKTAERARQIMTEFYHDQPDGVIGNEDCGQMSAWYIFSSIGFYPVFPAGGAYVIGSPMFDEAVLHLAAGRDFKVTVSNNSEENKYVQAVYLHGKKYDKSFILHSDIVKGGEMKIVMGPKPNYAFGAKPASRP